MVNYHNPVTIAQEFMALVKLWHVADGIFIWEFFTTLDYEWGVIRGHRPYRWTIWVYSLARFATLMAVILNMIGFDTTTPINCQAWVTSEVFFAYLALVTSALLIVLRVVAIWNREKVIVVIVMGLWLTDIGFLINGMIRLRSAWSPEANTCVLLNLETTRPNIIASLVTDVVLLLIMLIGLLHVRIEASGTFILGRVLWKQGLVWLLLATVAEVPPSVLMILNMNASLNLMPQTPSMVVVTIAATRLYRSLINIYSSDISHENPRGTGCSVSELRVRPRPISLNRTDVSVRPEYDQFPMSQSDPQMSRSGMYISTDPEGRYKVREVNLSVDVESGLKEK